MNDEEILKSIRRGINCTELEESIFELYSAGGEGFKFYMERVRVNNPTVYWHFIGIILNNEKYSNWIEILGIDDYTERLYRTCISFNHRM